MNNFFSNAVKELNITGYQVDVDVPLTQDDVLNATIKFKHHPCIIKIKDIVNETEIFTFNHKTENEIDREI